VFVVTNLVYIEGENQGNGNPSAELNTKETRVLTSTMNFGKPSLVQVECAYSRGFAGVQMIGNTSDVCKDGKERAKTALEGLDFRFPAKRMIISFSPADIKKDGNHFDLAIAVSMSLLLAEVELPVLRVDKYLFIAELGLSGELRPHKGVVPSALLAVAQGMQGIVCAEENRQDIDAVFVADPENSIEVWSFSNLSEVLAWLKDDIDAQYSTPKSTRGISPPHKDKCEEQLNFDDMILSPAQEQLALIVATGMHSLLLWGPPGAGKSMFACRLPSLLPLMSGKRHIEALSVHSLTQNKLPADLLMGRVPFRSPHHQASAVAVIGSGDGPGEMALAHGGILFLDELPEYRRDLLEALREPLSSGEVKVSRARAKAVWKCKVLLIAACNPCPCGFYGSGYRKCQCGPGVRKRYRSRISGPILDRIDLHFNLFEQQVNYRKMLADLTTQGRKTLTLVDRIASAHRFAKERNQDLGCRYNRDIRPKDLLVSLGASDETLDDFFRTVVPSGASHRSVINALRVARTLADLRQSTSVAKDDLELGWSMQGEEAALRRGDRVYGYSQDMAFEWRKGRKSPEPGDLGP
jgi:magnesium chelatase family protein